MTASLPNNHLQGRHMAAARIIAGILAVFFIAVFVIVAPDRYAQLSTISPDADTIVGQLLPEDAMSLQQFNLPVRIYAAYFTSFELLVAVACTLIALMIAWIRPDDRGALLVSLLLATTAMIVASLGMFQPQWRILVLAVRITWSTILIPFFYLFPDGRFVPRSTRWLAAIWLIYTVLWVFFPALSPPYGFGRGLMVTDFPRIVWILIWLFSGVIAQVYRYLRVSNAVQRQQTKWAVFGFVALLLTFVTGIFFLTLSTYVPPGPLAVTARLAGPSIILLGPIALSLSIGISALRYRLWDIDIIIRSTIVYSLLTAILALVYFGSVLLSQEFLRALTGQFEQSPISIVFSTLAIAALFSPLRKRIQTVIDQRFYRQKYDQAKVLASLSTTLREEVNLDRLIDSILNVVQETMQPAHLSAWFRKQPNTGRTQKKT